MKFKLEKKSQKEIDAIKNQLHFYAQRVKGVADTSNICPLRVVLANGQKVDTWNLTEQDIINLVKANAKEMTPNNGSLDKVGTANTFKVLKSWQEKHPTVSGDFVSIFYQLRDSFNGAQREVVRDMLTPLINETVEKAKINAKFLKGTKNNFKPVTEKEIVAVIKEQERQVEASKQQNKNSTL